MCGIAGIASFAGRPPEMEELRAMCGALVHRGPDDEGFHLGDGIGLGMRRLAIIDLETGHQPVRNEDGSVRVVFNGEIYNFRQLRRELEARGHAFYTATDTETIAHLYEEHGPRCVEKLRGMFAFAVWDARRRRLVLGRDRLGIKPLYYAEVGGRLLFASELKALLQIPEIPGRLDWSAIRHLFTFLCTPPSQSIIEGVRKLEPGHILVASPGHGVRTERYWDLAFQPEEARPEAYFVERLRALLEESVRLHLVGDVPLGAFLSGGLDSSAVVATMARLTSGPVRTFSIGFRDADYDELPYARLVAERFGTQHHALVLEPDALGVVSDVVRHLDEPFGDASAIPTYMVSKLAADHVTVVLSGDGGDELFAGYDRYLVEQRERRYQVVPRVLRRTLGALGGRLPHGTRGRSFLRHLALDGVERYLDASTLFRWDEQQRLFRPEAVEQLAAHDPWRVSGAQLAGPRGHWLSTLQRLDLKTYLPLDILTKVDRMSMAHSLEARVPLLDHELVEFAATIPPGLQLRDGTTKYLFKRAMRGILPEEVITRPKHGFGVPLGRWFRGELAGFVRDLLLSDASRRRGLLDTTYVERVLERHQRGRNLELPLWTLVCFELWCRTFVDQRPRPAHIARMRHAAAVPRAPRFPC